MKMQQLWKIGSFCMVELLFHWASNG